MPIANCDLVEIDDSNDTPGGRVEQHIVPVEVVMQDGASPALGWICS